MTVYDEVNNLAKAIRDSKEYAIWKIRNINRKGGEIYEKND